MSQSHALRNDPFPGGPRVCTNVGCGAKASTPNSFATHASRCTRPPGIGKKKAATLPRKAKAKAKAASAPKEAAAAEAPAAAVAEEEAADAPPEAPRTREARPATSYHSCSL